MGIDHTALVQEYLPAADNSIVRVEILGVNISMPSACIWPPVSSISVPPTIAGYQQLANGTGLWDGVSGRQVPVEAYTPPPSIVEAVKRITAAAHIEVGGVEYLVNARDGQAYFYDINALSNFVADAPNVVGFDPIPKLVDYLMMRAGLAESAMASTALRPRV